MNTNSNNNEKWIINVTNVTAWNFTESDEEASRILESAIQYEKESAELCDRHAADYPERADYWRIQAEKHRTAKFEIMSFDKFRAMQREKLLAGEPIEVTAEAWNDALDVLPPAKWTTVDGVEEFCMSERYTASYTTQYAHDHTTGKYFSKMVDMLDPSTWIHNYLRKQCA